MEIIKNTNTQSEQMQAYLEDIGKNGEYEGLVIVPVRKDSDVIEPYLFLSDEVAAKTVSSLIACMHKIQSWYDGHNLMTD